MCRSFVLMALILLANRAICQKIVSGKVLEAYSGKPIQGARVKVPSRNIDLFTDSAGNFVVQGERDTVIVEQKGFETRKLRLPESGTISISMKRSHEAGDIYTVVQHPAYFPGGMNAFSKYLHDNLKFPPESLKAGIVGRVFVEFVIDTTGSIMPNEIKVMKSLDPACDQEAIRLIKGSPKWISGVNNDKRVRQKMLFPVIFKPEDQQR